MLGPKNRKSSLYGVGFYLTNQWCKAHLYAKGDDEGGGMEEFAPYGNDRKHYALYRLLVILPLMFATGVVRTCSISTSNVHTYVPLMHRQRHKLLNVMTVVSSVSGSASTRDPSFSPL